MKISIDGRASKWYRGTGIGTYTYQLINNLNQIDFLNQYDIFFPDNCSLDIQFKDNFNLLKGSSNHKSNFWEDIKIPNNFSNTDIDIYHIPQNGIGISKKFSIPTVITLHDIIPLKMPETVSSSYLKIFYDEIPQILSTADGIITVSEFSKNDIYKEFNYPKEKIFVTHLAAEDIYTPLSKTFCKNYLKSEYGINDDFILYVGGFSPRKNILGLIESFSMVLPKYSKPIKLVILGKHGISYELYKNRVIELGIEEHVLFPGFIPLNDMPIFYSGSSLFVYPSFYEGFGLPPLEAMACGTPTIASDLTAIPEVLESSSLLINPYDVDELRNSMLEVLTNKQLANNLIKKGFIHCAKFNWKKTAYDTLDSYDKIIKIQ